MPPGLDLRLDRETLLARHWQREPLLVRDAVPGFTPPLSRHELAGLAMDEDIEARIVACEHGHWQVHHGPFGESDYRRATPWTLLVQAVDQVDPGVAALRRMIDFIPGWRLDDVMVSYGDDGASVGPHYDHYDVFLLQGEGEKTWRLGQYCDAHTPLLPHDELRILRDFEQREEYLLRSGDLLYVPPGVAHWGIARGDSTTFSIGFRAPRVNDMVSRFADQLLAAMDPELFYRDAGQAPATHPGEIRRADLDRALGQLQAALDQAQDSAWFGELVTEPRYDCTPDGAQLRRALQRLGGEPAAVELHAAAKLAWQADPDGILAFANGDSARFDAGVRTALERLCGDWVLDGRTLRDVLDDAEGRRLLEYLLHSGCIDVR
ncbi:MAG: cupin [Halioglobus sp.]|nr:cupin [Halioglobus sp.]